MPMINLVLLVNFGQIIYVGSCALSKDMLSNRGVKVFEFAFIRSCFNMIASAILVKYTFRENFFTSIPSDLVPTTILRCITGTTGFLSFTAAPKYLPLGIFCVIVNSQVFSTVLLSYCWLRERISLFEAIAIVIAFAGILMMSLSKVDDAEE